VAASGEKAGASQGARKPLQSTNHSKRERVLSDNHQREMDRVETDSPEEGKLTSALQNISEQHSGQA